MASKPLQDKRLVDRALRRGDLSRSDLEAAAQDLPDEGSGGEAPSQEDLDKLRSELETEGAERKARIERFMEEGPQPEEKPEPIPFNENDL